MSHTLNFGGPGSGQRTVLITIIDYTNGGEAFTLSEFSINTLQGVILGNIPPSGSSLAVPLFPVLDGAKVRLFQFVSGSPVEIASKVALNASMMAIIFFD